MTHRPKIHEIKLKRAYEAPAAEDGMRVLVDRLWPRGVSKAAARLDLWLRDLAPSTALRQSFGHQPGRWQKFEHRYFEELRTSEPARAALARLYEEAGGKTVTLIFAARDTEHNNAVALRRFLLGEDA